MNELSTKIIEIYAHYLRLVEVWNRVSNLVEDGNAYIVFSSIGGGIIENEEGEAITAWWTKPEDAAEVLDAAIERLERGEIWPR